MTSISDAARNAALWFRSFLAPARLLGDYETHQLELEIQHAIDASRPTLVWSSEKPTAPGWYCLRLVGSEHWWIERCPEPSSWLRVSTPNWQFAGPIAPPEERR